MKSEVNLLEGASCAGLPDSEKEIFFSSGGATKVAKRICSFCPVQAECLADVLTWEVDGERFGVYGGMSAGERQREFAGMGPKRKDVCRSERHEMTPENTHILPSGHRRCKACQSMNAAKQKRLARGRDVDPYGEHTYSDSWADLDAAERKARIDSPANRAHRERMAREDAVYKEVADSKGALRVAWSKGEPKAIPNDRMMSREAYWATRNVA